MRMNECAQNGLIIHPGAIGDCLLALPLASFMKEKLGITRIDWIGRTEYTDFYPGRTAVDQIHSLESIPMHRLFQDSRIFDVEDNDPLFRYFSGYQQVVSFLGSDDPHFEQNLIYTIHCSQTAHVLVLPVDETSYPGHISNYYLQQAAAENEITLENWFPPQRLIEPHPDDFSAGRQILEDIGINPDHSTIVIHPGSGGTHKCWALENFVLLAEQIKQAGHEPIFLLGPAEIERWSDQILQSIEKHSILTKLNLMQTFQVLTCVDGYAGNDSGISHLAAVMGKPTLAVFGPTNPEKFSPIGPKAKILRIDPAVFDRFSAPDVTKAAKLLFGIV